MNFILKKNLQKKKRIQWELCQNPLLIVQEEILLNGINPQGQRD